MDATRTNSNDPKPPWTLLEQTRMTLNHHGRYSNKLEWPGTTMDGTRTNSNDPQPPWTIFEQPQRTLNHIERHSRNLKRTRRSFVHLQRHEIWSKRRGKKSRRIKTDDRMAIPFMTMDIDYKIPKISIYSALSHGTYTTLKAYTDVNYIFYKVIFSLRLDFN